MDTLKKSTAVRDVISHPDFLVDAVGVCRGASKALCTRQVRPRSESCLLKPNMHAQEEAEDDSEP